MLIGVRLQIARAIRNQAPISIRAVSSVWLERLLDTQEVTGSTPVPPMVYFLYENFY